MKALNLFKSMNPPEIYFDTTGLITTKQNCGYSNFVIFQKQNSPLEGL